MTEAYVGIDIGARTQVAAIIPATAMTNSDWRTYNQRTIQVANTAADYHALAHRIRTQAPQSQDAACGLEASGYHYARPIAQYLASHWPTWIIDGATVHDARKRLFNITRKDDQIDACCLARLLYLKETIGEDVGAHPVRYETMAASFQLRSLARQRWATIKTATAQKNRIRAITAGIFPEAADSLFNHYLALAETSPTPQQIAALTPDDIPHTAIRVKKHRQRIIDLAADTCGADPQPYATTLPLMVNHYHQLLHMKDEIERQIAAQLTCHQDWPILKTFPGISPWDAAVILGAAGPTSDSPTKKTYRRRLGLYPETHQTGKRPTRSRMGKGGSPDGRRVMVQWAMRLQSPVMPPNPIHQYLHRRRDGGMNGKRALIASAGKLAEIIWACCTHGTPYQPDHIPQPRGTTQWSTPPPA